MNTNDLQLGSPEVKASGRRVGTADLSHAQADEHDKERDNKPTPDGDDRASCGHSKAEQWNNSDQDRGVGKREAKVLKTGELTPNGEKTSTMEVRTLAKRRVSLQCRADKRHTSCFACNPTSSAFKRMVGKSKLAS